MLWARELPIVLDDQVITQVLLPSSLLVLLIVAFRSALAARSLGHAVPPTTIITQFLYACLTRPLLPSRPRLAQRSYFRCPPAHHCVPPYPPPFPPGSDYWRIFLLPLG